MDTLRYIYNQTVAYLDLTGSGNETAAHIMENGRLTIMFCSFSEQPLILRLYGRGKVVQPKDEAWQRFHSHFRSMFGERQIIVLHVESAQTSCGFGVPVYELKEERPTLTEWTIKKGEEGIKEYWKAKNQISIDGLPTHLVVDNNSFNRSGVS